MANTSWGSFNGQGEGAKWLATRTDVRYWPTIALSAYLLNKTRSSRPLGGCAPAPKSA
jgi:hypothetical protein